MESICLACCRTRSNCLKSLCVLSLAALCFSARAEIDRNPLAFERDIIDLNIVEADTSTAHLLKFVNVTSSPVTVAKAETTCDCAELTLDTPEVLPGKSSILQIRFTRAENVGLNIHLFDFQDRLLGQTELRATVVDTSGTLDKIRFDQKISDLRKGETGTPLTGKLRFKNASNKRLEGLHLIPSCGCTRAELDKKSLAPHESTIIDYQIEQPKGGRKTVTLSVRGDKEERLGSAEIHAEFVDPVRIDPEVLYLGTLSPAVETPISFRVLPGSHRAVKIDLQGGQSVQRLSAEKPDGTGAAQVSGVLTPASDVQSTTVSVAALLEDGRTVRKNVPLFYAIQSAYEVIPERLFMGFVKDPALECSANAVLRGTRADLEATTATTNIADASLKVTLQSAGQASLSFSAPGANILAVDSPHIVVKSPRNSKDIVLPIIIAARR